MNRRDICFLLGGTAIGSLAACAMWKYRPFILRNRTSVIWESFQNLQCWPFGKTNLNSPVSIHVISEANDFDEILQQFLNDVNEVGVLGFDCEWTTSDCTSNPISLLQLATSSGRCYLLRLCKLGDGVHNEISEILRNKSVIKVGVGCMDDAAKLMKDYGIVVQGCLDLRAFCAQYEISRARGLQSLAKELTGIKLDKSLKLRCSNWDADTLDAAQINYAAYDALTALRIFEVLLQKQFNKQPPNHEDLSKIAHELSWNLVQESIRELTDTPFKERKNRVVPAHKRLQTNNNLQQNMRGIPKNPKLYKSIKPHSVRQQPLYDNCRLQAPDGQLLSTCDRKKANWYMEKNLAELICENPMTVRLFFEPSGRPENDRDYYLYEKENKCVVCAGTKSFVRKNIIPHEYRKHFPIAMKDHTSHDILLLCLPCFQQSNYHDCLFRRKLSEEYHAPHGSIQAIRMYEDSDRRSVRSAGRALQKCRDTIPEGRRRELEVVILEYFDVFEITDDIIKEACDLETRVLNETYVPHGEKVVKSIFKQKGPQGLLDFEKRWREHFLETMKPLHLPVLWSVNHNHEKVTKYFDQMNEEFQRKFNAKTSPAVR